MSKKEKILVEIISDNGIKKRKCEIEENSVIIEKGSRGRGKATYKAEFNKSCILLYRVGFLFFKRLKQKLMLMNGADKCISFENNTAEIAVFDRETSNRHIRANVIKSAGATTQKLSIPISIYLILGVIAFLEVITLLLATGRIRIV